MKLGIYCIYDKKAMMFQVPFFGITDAQTIRNLQQRFNRNQESPEYIYPQDFCVYHVGYFDDQHGLIQAFDSAELIIELTAIIEKEKTSIED